MQARWGWLLLVGLAGCEPEPRGPTQVKVPETQHFETQSIRREVDRYKDAPSLAARRKMEQAFGALDAKLRAMEAQASTMEGNERALMDFQIANLKKRRDLHWTRAQTAVAQLEPVEKARPVGERSDKVVKARPAAAQPARTSRPRRVYRPTAPPSENIFQRIGRLFH